MKDIERMVVSAHADGEVESPWKEQVARKIGEDPDWAAEAAVHNRVKTALASAPEPNSTPSLDRVWTRLEQLKPRKHEVVHGSFLWVGVAAAALLVIATGTGYWLGRQAPGQSGPGSEVAELQVQVPKDLGLKLSGEGQLIMASTLQGSRR